jgi:DNA ligase (NAD+)
MEEGIPPLANPRNAAAGTLRIKDPQEAAKRNLEAFVYHVSFYTLSKGKKIPEALNNHAASLELLWNLGFSKSAKRKEIIQRHRRRYSILQ